MFGIGIGELVVILLVALVVFGPQRLPEAARQLGLFIHTLQQNLRVLQGDVFGREHEQMAQGAHPKSEPTQPPRKGAHLE